MALEGVNNNKDLGYAYKMCFNDGRINENWAHSNGFLPILQEGMTEKEFIEAVNKNELA